MTAAGVVVSAVMVADGYRVVGSVGVLTIVVTDAVTCEIGIEEDGAELVHPANTVAVTTRTIVIMPTSETFII